VLSHNLNPELKPLAHAQRAPKVLGFYCEDQVYLPKDRKYKERL
jgi:hypothetical protein